MAGEAVLVVENEAPARAYLAQQLADDGFEVLAAERGGEALELAAAVRPDLILLDAVLPDVSGFELCGRLRRGEPGRGWDPDVPVIMVSSRAESADRLRGFARGADDYVPKPSCTPSSLRGCAPSCGGRQGPVASGSRSASSRSTSAPAR